MSRRTSVHVQCPAPTSFKHRPPYAPQVTPYEIEIRPEPGVTVVVLSGELDLTNARDAEHRLGDTDEQRLVLDLTRVTFLDSAALHMIFRLARRHSATHPLGICIDPGAPIARTLAIVGLHEVAVVRPTLDELVATELTG